MRLRGLRYGLIAAAFLAALPVPASVPSPPRKPNFVVILCDDLGYNDLGCYTYPSKANPGPPPALCPIGYTNYNYLPAPNSAYAAARPDQTLTPRIDRLAAEGIRFTSFYSCGPVCSPARAALMTGCYPYRVGVNAVLSATSNNGLHTTEITVAEMLKDQGYATAHVGKWHLGHHPQFLPTRQGFDEYFGIPYSNDMAPQNLYEDETILESIGTDPVKQSLLTQRYTVRALDFISRNTNRPFFLYLAHNMPHMPVHASTNFAGASGKSPFYDVLMEIDWSVGQVLDRLRQLGLEQDTLVMFSSDNGPWYARGSANNAERSCGSAYPLRESKGTTGEGGLRVPFLARWPGRVPAGQVTDAVGGLIDVLPTLAKLAGGGPPADRVLDGRDLWPLLSGQAGAVSPHPEFYYFNSGTLEAIRSGPWKLRKAGTNLLNDYLVHLDSDLQELTNLASAFPAVSNQLQQLKASFATEISAQKRPQGTYSTQEIVLSASRLTVPEGGTATFQVKLAEAPAADLAVEVQWFSGDPHLAISTGAPLNFTSNNWDVFQTVTVSAAPDADTLPGTATLRCSSTAFQPVRDLYATEGDDDVVPMLEVALGSPATSVVHLRDGQSWLLAEGMASLNGIIQLDGVGYAWSATPSAGVDFSAPTSRITGIRLGTNGEFTVQLTAAWEDLSAQSQFTVRIGSSNTVSVQDLIARFPLDESFGASAGDVTGLGHHGTLSGSPVWRPTGGRVKGAIEFNSATDLVTVPDSNLLNLSDRDKRTIALWFNPGGTGTPPGRQVIYEEGGTTRGLSLYLDGGQCYIGGWNNGSNGWSNTYLSTTNPLVAGRWYHAALVLDAVGPLTADAFRGYLDGAPFAQGSAATLTAHTDNLGLGGIAEKTRFHDGTTPAAGTNSFTGLVDEVLIYNRALSADEIVRLAQGPVNLAPQVNAGTDQTISITNSAPLAGIVTDDGLPGINALTFWWTQIRGPGIAVFADPSNAATTVSFDLPGQYELGLMADDTEARTYHSVQVTVPPLTYPEWLGRQPLLPGQTNAPLDPDGDGLPNVFEFALGLDPLVPDVRAHVLRFTPILGADPLRLVLEFDRPRDRAPAFLFQDSADLIHWNSIATPPTILPLPNLKERVTYSLELPPHTAQRFVRLVLQP